MGKLSGKTAIITGASSGFGRGTALAFAREGTNLVLTARREERLKEVMAACEALVSVCSMTSNCHISELRLASNDVCYI